MNAGGTSKNLKNYSFADNNLLKGQIYYRLRMVDLDGTFAHSSIESVNFDEGQVLSMYPNPASDRLIFGNYRQLKKVELFNASGIRVLSKSQLSSQGLDISRFPAGAYFVKMILLDGSLQAGKVMITR